MGFHIRRYIFLSTCLIQMISVVQRQVFDFLGFLWIPILVNFFEIIFIILGFFGGYQNRGKYIISYLSWQVLWIFWNIFMICLYSDIGQLNHKTNKVLKLDRKSESWWRTEGPQCKKTLGPQLSPDIEILNEVENCLFNYIDVEIFQCGLQTALAILAVIFGVNLIKVIWNYDDSSFLDKSSKRKRQRTSLYSIEFNTELDNRQEEYGNHLNQLPAAMSPKPMTPRKVKRRSVMTRGSSSRYSTSSKRHSGVRSSTRSSRRSLQNPITRLMDQQKSLSSFECSQQSEPQISHLNMSNNNLNTYSHANLTYQQSSTQSLNKMDDLDELYNGRPASVRSSYSNFHGTRDFNYANVNPYQHNHATPQVPQKKHKLRNGSVPMFLNNGPPAYSSQQMVISETIDPM